MSDLRNAINEINKELSALGEEARTGAQSLINALASIGEGHAEPSEWVYDISEMHHKFGVNDAVSQFDKSKLLAYLQFRLNFLQEELDEAKTAYAVLLSSSTVNGEAAKANGNSAADDVVDAMIDLCVVAIGTLNALDVDADEAWTRVMAANMQKEPGIKPERPNPLGLPDMIKPTGWVAPVHGDNVGLLEKLYT
jgi:predicted HAD superfamily Cof-like phosphohydrolase